MQKITKIIKNSLPAIVSVVATKSLRELEKELPAQLFPLMPFGMPDLNIPEDKMNMHGMIEVNSGSGFITDPSGVILTNKHVIVDPEAEYEVLTSSGKKYRAEILARDPIEDVAILKIPAIKLPTLKLGNSEKIELGDEVLAIGNALGMFQNTVSKGIVSGLSRVISPNEENDETYDQQLRGLIQTDAAINPGNSGGPLINLKGEVIGINAAIISGAQSIGFAIPINSAKKDLDDVKKYGEVRRPFLGIRYVNIDKDLKERMGLPVDYGAIAVGQKGSREAIVKNSPAYKAGVVEGDIVLECNGQRITPTKTIQDFLENMRVGEKINLKILRKNKEMNISIELSERK
ncbi:MAG: trypsin-like peptidase domain-containing protein [Patescibacteria group bacterium]|nr:trypsin-like peptidase domain-containing protein [Patescibacteria group bacterium]